MNSMANSVTLRVDVDQRTPLNPIWAFGGNTCHAPLWLRDDLNRHLATSHDKLGFRYVRAHGSLGDNMGTIDADGAFDFSRLFAGIDRLRAHGLLPFLELSHMPSALASNDKALAAYKFRSAPPNDWDRWYQMIRALMEGLVSRYGLGELRQWYFEVWNEPDIAFWSGTREEYFRLYDLTARAVKEADPTLRIGGPATARTNWIDEFLEHLGRPSSDFGLDATRCDFISTHAYPSDLEFLDAAEGEVTLQSSDLMRELFAAVRQKVDRALGEDFPVICGEWNSSAGPLAENHDQCNNGAFIAKTMIELSDLCQGSLVWNISDIYEECGFHTAPFHGGYGQITVNGIPKAGFHAFALLHEHAGERIGLRLDAAPRGVGGLASLEGQTLRVLLHYYQEPDAATPGPVVLDLQGLPAGAAELVTVRPGAGSAYEPWVEWGRPEFVDRCLLEALESASAPARQRFTVGHDTLSLNPGEIAQLTLKRTSFA